MYAPYYPSTTDVQSSSSYLIQVPSRQVTVYVAYVFLPHDCYQLVGIFSTKGKAYTAARARVWAEIEQYRDSATACGYSANDYEVRWTVIEMELDKEY